MRQRKTQCESAHGTPRRAQRLQIADRETGSTALRNQRSETSAPHRWHGRSYASSPRSRPLNTSAASARTEAPKRTLSAFKLQQRRRQHGSQHGSRRGMAEKSIFDKGPAFLSRRQASGRCRARPALPSIPDRIRGPGSSHPTKVRKDNRRTPAQKSVLPVIILRLTRHESPFGCPY